MRHFVRVTGLSPLDGREDTQWMWRQVIIEEALKHSLVSGHRCLILSNHYG